MVVKINDVLNLIIWSTKGHKKENLIHYCKKIIVYELFNLHHIEIRIKCHKISIILYH